MGYAQFFWVIGLICIHSLDTEDGIALSRSPANVPSDEGIIKVLELWSRIVNVDARERID